MTTSVTNRPPDTAGPVEEEWLSCPDCRSLLYRKRLERGAKVCYECGRYFRLTAAERLDLLLDPGSAELVEPAATVHDPLEFTDLQPYERRSWPRRGRAAGRRTRCSSPAGPSAARPWSSR